MNAHLVEWLIQAGLMAAGIAAVLRLLRIPSAAARHAAWTAVLAVMLLMPAWTAWGPKLALPILPEAGRTALEPILPEGDLLQLPPEPVISMISVHRGETRPGPREPSAAWPWARIVLGCYFAGAGVMLARLIAGTVRARALVRRAAPDDGVLAAADAPASDELRHSTILMNLPRTLIDWGERDAAVQFLDRIASKTLGAKEFQDWAGQIRKGENPDMRPVMVGCGQERC